MAPLTLVQPVENFQTIPLICSVQQHYIMGGCNCQPTYQPTAQVIYSIQGSGYLFGSILKILLNQIEKLEVQYNQIQIPLTVKPKQRFIRKYTHLQLIQHIVQFT